MHSSVTDVNEPYESLDELGDDDLGEAILDEIPDDEPDDDDDETDGDNDDEIVESRVVQEVSAIDCQKRYLFDISSSHHLSFPGSRASFYYQQTLNSRSILRNRQRCEFCFVLVYNLLISMLTGLCSSELKG